MNSTVIINGKLIQGNGNISVINNKIYVDGKDITPDAKEINIQVNGNINELKIDVANKLLIQGNVTNIQSTSADIQIKGNVLQNIRTTSGDVKCEQVLGNIKTVSGDVKKLKKPIEDFSVDKEEKNNNKVKFDLVNFFKSL